MRVLHYNRIFHLQLLQSLCWHHHGWPVPRWMGTGHRLETKRKNFCEKSSFLTLNVYNPFQIISWHTWSTEGQCVNLVGRWANLCTHSGGVRGLVLAGERIWDEPSALFICRLHRLQTTYSTNIHESSSYSMSWV